MSLTKVLHAGNQTQLVHFIQFTQKNLVLTEQHNEVLWSHHHRISKAAGRTTGKLTGDPHILPGTL
jgi:hypothetical protein